MSQQIASLYAEISADTTKLQSGLKQSKDKLGQFKNSLNDVVQGVTGMNLAQIGLTTAIVSGVNGVRKAIDEYSNYATAIDKMASVTGMGTEELSRIVQVADDFRVEMGSVQTAMKMALQNGFNPTTESLAQLADELNAISDPTERAAKAQSIFGRSWQEIMPMLEQGGAAIRDAAAGISDGMIVTEQAAKANYEYYKSLDSLNDALTGVKNKVASELIPVLTDAANALNILITWQEAIDGALNNNNRSVVRASQTYEEYLAIQQKVYKNAGLVLTTTGDQVKVTTNYASGLKDVTDQYQVYTEAQYNAIKSGREYGPSVAEMTVAVKEATTVQEDYNNQQRETSNLITSATGSTQEYLDAITGLQDAQKNLAQATENFNQGSGKDVAGMLDDSYISADRYKEGLKAIDEATGSSLLPQKELADAQKKLAEQYRTGEIDAGKFKEKLIELNDKFAPFDQGIKDSTELMESLLAKLREFSRTWTAQVRISGEGASGNIGAKATNANGGNSYNWEDYANAAGATGINNLVVPPGYSEAAGRPFMVATSSGETVNVTPQGRSGSGSGNTYNLTIYTSASADVVQRGFSTMQMLAGV